MGELGGGASLAAAPQLRPQENTLRDHEERHGGGGGEGGRKEKEVRWLKPRQPHRAICTGWACV